MFNPVHRQEPISVPSGIYARELALVDYACKEKQMWYFEQSNEYTGDKVTTSIVYLLIIIYVFNSIAILSKEYYNDSISEMEKSLGLDKDLSSSTLLSFGGSTPELCISLQAVFIDTNIAVGTIIGSSLFNTLLLAGIACVFGRKDTKVNWFPIVRDIFFTLLAIMILTLPLYFNLNTCPAKSTWNLPAYEESYVGGLLSLSLLCYLLYIFFMKYTQRIEKFVKSFFRMNISDIYSTKRMESSNGKDTIYKVGEMILYEGNKYDLQSLSDSLNDFIDNKRKKRESLMLINDNFQETAEVENPLSSTFATFIKAYKVYQEATRYTGRSGWTQYFKNMEERNMKIKENMDMEIEVVEDTKRVFTIPEGFLPKLKWLLEFPISLLYYYTIPEVSEEGGRYMFSFCICCFYILVWSILEVFLSLEICRILQKDPMLAGILLLAFGSGIPDLLEMIETLKEGESFTAVLQTTGSNVFVYSFTLPFPLLFKYLLNTNTYPNAIMNADKVLETLTYSACTFGFYLLLFTICRWELKKVLGYLLLATWVSIIAILAFINWDTPILQHN